MAIKKRRLRLNPIQRFDSELQLEGSSGTERSVILPVLPLSAHAAPINRRLITPTLIIVLVALLWSRYSNVLCHSKDIFVSYTIIKI